MDTTILVIKVHILKQAQPPGNGRQRQDSIINRNDNELHTQICRTLCMVDITHYTHSIILINFLCLYLR